MVKRRIEEVVEGIQSITGQAVIAVALFVCLMNAGIGVCDTPAGLREDPILDFKPINRRWVYLGKHGELFVPKENSALNGYNELLIEPFGDGLALIHLGKKSPVKYAIIHPNCTIQYTMPLPEGMDLLSAVNIWPYHGENVLPVMPPYGVVIAAENALLPEDTVVPDGMIGWVFLCVDDGFYVPGKDVPVHANTLWVVKKTNELHFIRTGPIAKGELYATVKSNREVIFAPGIYDGPSLCWGLVDEQGIPAFSSHQRRWAFISPCDENREPAVLSHKGYISRTLPLMY